MTLVDQIKSLSAKLQSTPKNWDDHGDDHLLRQMYRERTDLYQDCYDHRRRIQSKLFHGEEPTQKEMEDLRSKKRLLDEMNERIRARNEENEKARTSIDETSSRLKELIDQYLKENE
jgi:hypothetical protein